ncbi:ZYRO0A10230p [Zygosaccharomyces rouxii]|uniref:Small ribosomal subunit protein mS33 n=1 Tax=Zygosaccharomyces rouxii (strain ATCC 2623 / CBS 732 / NBRC 1130 / NCYC 568 / NRRL Y-229) TaxID=559307 RepID=C5DQB8_ZYGRC|nr:mitochondrial 37S ribosomal protein RSM27 [Zygosaccharomyces rouxii]KAH9198602.1 mitochondrial 37S ribosomal protein RSM27 [Zygosaccharomyces rouxii]CAR25879.1 ZYRO0A10230p [Zygosaccharomyces rouxii]
MTVSKDRLLKVAELSAKIFDQNFNPSGVRTGSQILAKRLKGPAVASYYGDPDLLRFRHLRTLYPGFKFADLDEEYRLTMLEARKRRGKGAPKKKKEATSGGGKAKKRK